MTHEAVRSTSRLGACALAILCATGRASAQQPTPGIDGGGPDPATVRVRIGPLWMNPKLELKNIGVDTNVFNEPEEQHPKRDFTATISPNLDIWVGIGPTWLQTNIREDIVWYDTYSSERSANETYSLSWRVPLNRLAFRIAPSYMTTRERPGYEIDARARHTQWGGDAQVEVHALSKTTVALTTTYKNIAFDNSATFLGVNLSDQLDRTESSVGVSVKHELTPLTTVVASAVRERDRFEREPLRDADSTQIGMNVQFDPHALLKGGAAVGYRDFQPVDRSLPAFTGLTAQGDLAYTLFGSTRFQVQFRRDISYSYDVNQPYYLQNGVTGTVAQQVFGPFDALAKVGIASLAYRDRTGVAVAAPDRVDDVQTLGGGAGYHIGGTGTRLGFNVEHERRTSEVALRRYSGLRYGASLTYDF
jgi:hypothetical protein